MTLRRREGTSVDALRERAKEAEKAAAKERLARAAEATAQSSSLDGTKATQKARADGKVSVRQDSSPIKVRRFARMSLDSLTRTIYSR